MVLHIDAINADMEKKLEEQRFDELFRQYNTLMNWEVMTTHPVGLARAMASVAKAHYMMGNYQQSLSLSLQSLRNFTVNKDSAGIANIANIIGLIYHIQGKYKLAQCELRRAIRINSHIGEKKRLAANYLNMGLVFLSMKSLDSSRTFLTRARWLAQTVAADHIVSMSYNRLAQSYEVENKLDVALFYYHKVLHNRTFQSAWENSFAHIGVAKCLYKRRDYKGAITHARTGLGLAEKCKTKWDIEQALEVLISAQEKSGDYKSAYRNLLKQKKYSDSLLNRDKRLLLDSMHISQQNASNELLSRENETMNKELQIQDIWTVFFISLTILLLLLVLVVIKTSKRTDKLNKKLQEQAVHLIERKETIKDQNRKLATLNQTKDFLFSVISHDLRAPLSSIITYFGSIRGKFLAPEVEEQVVDKLYAQTLATQHMVDKLLIWADSQQSGLTATFSRVNVEAAVNEVLNFSRTIGQQKDIRFDVTIDAALWMWVDKNHFKIILENIIGNAIKFTPKGGAIAVDARVHQHETEIIVADSGIGMAEETVRKLAQGDHVPSHVGTGAETGVGLGMKLVHLFLACNNGRLCISSEQGAGTEVSLFFAHKK